LFERGLRLELIDVDVTGTCQGISRRICKYVGASLPRLAFRTSTVSRRHVYFVRRESQLRSN
jgi:hypothetical protein